MEIDDKDAKEFTEKELTLIKKLDENVGHTLLNPDDRNPYFYVKWLRARDLDLSKAQAMLTHSIEWRKNNKLEDISTWIPPEVVTRYIPFGLLGFESEGYTVSVIPIGRIDIRGLVESCGKEPIVRYTIKLLDMTFDVLKKHSKEIGRNVDQIIVIIDCNQLGISHLLYEATIDLVIKLVKIYEANYPESLKHAYIINAPRVFTIIFGLIKPILSQHTLNKISVFGFDDAKWKKALLDNIPSEILPPHWGGTLDGPDEFCTDKVCIGGKVPESYHAKKKGASTSSEASDDFHTLNLTAGEKKTIKIEMEETNPSFRLTVKVAAFDVQVSVTSSEGKEIYSRKVSANDEILSEVIPCTQGSYDLTFDNSYSKFRSKTVRYFVSKEIQDEQ